MQRSMYKWAMSVTAVFLALAAGPARADIVVASNLPSGFSLSSFDIGIGFSNGTTFTNEAAAQEFTAQASGHLTTLTSTLEQVSAGGVPLIVSFFTVSGSSPGSLLGSVTIPQSQVSSNVFTTLSNFDISAANVNVTAGQSYIVTFTVTTPIASSDRYLAGLLNPNASFFGFQPLFSTNGGTTWAGEGIPNEVGLTLFAASAAPEPSSLTLLGVAGVAGLVFGRRWRTTV
jgi:PEP-CTERM motif-containing protein